MIHGCLLVTFEMGAILSCTRGFSHIHGRKVFRNVMESCQTCFYEHAIGKGEDVTTIFTPLARVLHCGAFGPTTRGTPKRKACKLRMLGKQKSLLSGYCDQYVGCHQTHKCFQTCVIRETQQRAEYIRSLKNFPSLSKRSRYMYIISCEKCGRNNLRWMGRKLRWDVWYE